MELAGLEPATSWVRCGGGCRALEREHSAPASEIRSTWLAGAPDADGRGYARMSLDLGTGVRLVPNGRPPPEGPAARAAAPHARFGVIAQADAQSPLGILTAVVGPSAAGVPFDRIGYPIRSRDYYAIFAANRDPRRLTAADPIQPWPAARKLQLVQASASTWSVIGTTAGCWPWSASLCSQLSSASRRLTFRASPTTRPSRLQACSFLISRAP